jgi:hypothetical protein
LKYGLAPGAQESYKKGEYKKNTHPLGLGYKITGSGDKWEKSL